MQEGILTEVKEPKLIKKAIEEVVSSKGFKNIKANVEDFEKPSKLSRGGEDEDEAFIPDITGTLRGRKSYFEIAQKNDNLQQVVTKWKLLSNLARFRKGKFFLLVPDGSYAFTQRILKKYPIEAKVIKF